LLGLTEKICETHRRGFVEDHYATLQVRASASAEEIERAYRRLARLHHPDLLRGASPDARRHAEELLKRINRAHGVIGDRERRRDYDRTRRTQRAAVGPVPRSTAPPPAPTPTPRAPAERTTHWGGGGPIDIEWETPLERAPRQTTELFSLGRLLRYAAAIILFAALLAIVWRPGLGRPAPAPSLTPTARLVTVTPPPTPGPTLVPVIGTPQP
jgi:hypothetical protein